MVEQIAPGWYPNPENERELRWWDGERWTDQIHKGEVDTTANTSSSGAQAMFFVIVVVFVLACVFVAISL